MVIAAPDDARDDIDAVAKRMALKEGDNAQETPRKPKIAKAKATPAKAKAKKGSKGGSAACTEKTFGDGSKAGPSKSSGGGESGTWPKRPSICVDSTLKQFMRRTGKGGAGSSHKIPWSENGGKAGALTQAKAWQNNAMKEYTLHVKK